MRKSFCFFWVAALLCAGCAKRAAMYQKATGLSEGERGQTRQANLLYLTPSVRGSGFGGSGAVLAAGRFVAVQHKLEIVEASSGLAKSIEAVVAFCGTIQCEVLSSSVTNETAILSPSGNIAARVAPPDLNKFLDFVGKQGRIAQHSTESEDKTAAVIDVEAKLKNQTEFRDSLRKMLTSPASAWPTCCKSRRNSRRLRRSWTVRRRSARSSRMKLKRSMSKSRSAPNNGRLAEARSRPLVKRSAISGPTLATASPPSSARWQPSFPG